MIGVRFSQSVELIPLLKNSNVKGNRREVGIELKLSSSKNYNLGTHEKR